MKVTQEQADRVAADPQLHPCTCGHTSASHVEKRRYRGVGKATTFPCIVPGCRCEDRELVEFELVQFAFEAAERVLVQIDGVEGFVLAADLHPERPCDLGVADDDDQKPGLMGASTQDLMRAPTTDPRARGGGGRQRTPAPAKADIAGRNLQRDQEVSADAERPRERLNVRVDAVTRAWMRAQPGRARELLERDAHENLQEREG